MSLQRGSFGIEFDERPGFPYGKLGWIVVVIPAVALAALFFRGCARDEKPADVSSSSGLREASVSKEPRAQRLPILQHLSQTLRSDKGIGGEKERDARSASATKEETGVPAAGEFSALMQKQSPDVRRLLQRIAEREGADDLVGARLLYRELLVRGDAEGIRTFVERKIGEIGTTLLFSDRPAPEKFKYRVAEGDLVAKIVKKFGNTPDFLLKVNGIGRPESLRAGREIWMLKNPVFELTVFRKSGSAVLTLNGRFFKRYLVKVGKTEDVPPGVYAVSGRVLKPTGRQADGDARDGVPTAGAPWIALASTGDTPASRGLGLHGVWTDSTLGRSVDAARVRFSNADIAELYLLLPSGALINITE